MEELCFKVGRPRKWDSPEQLQAEIDAYFKECDNKTVLHGDKIFQGVPYTVQGLCLVLDCDRKTLLNYEKEEGCEEFFHTIKKAKLRIEQQKVQNGLMGISNPAVTIFDLKNNHDHVDKQEIASTGTKEVYLWEGQKEEIT